MQQSYKIVRQTRPAENAVRLLLNGKFGEADLPELDESIAAARDQQFRVYLDLSEVTLVDRKTAQFFGDRASPEVRIVNCPVYLKRWIAQVSDELDS